MVNTQELQHHTKNNLSNTRKSSGIVIRGLANILYRQNGNSLDKLHAKAQVELKAENFEAAFSFFLEAAKQNHASSEYFVGWLLLNGKGVDENHKEAVRWFIKSADQGYSEAQNILGECYLYGIGIIEDSKLAIEWFIKSASQNNTEALYNLGDCYFIGWGVDENEEEAFKWYEKSAVTGSSDAQNIIGLFYLHGRVVEENQKFAIELFVRSAKQNNPYAKNHLGDCYLVGWGVEKDIKQAFHWYSKAAKEHDFDLKFNLVECCYHGWGDHENDDCINELHEKTQEHELEEEFLFLLKKIMQVVGLDVIKVALASPEKIRSWSYGEVKKTETINYRTFKPERDGLFCSKIFGPIKDYECLCGKYKRLKHRGVICEKCGVEVTLSKVRCERMGHIELASPVAHIWFLKNLLNVVLDITLRDIERVLYFEAFFVVDPGMTPLTRGQLLTVDDYIAKVYEYGDEFDAVTGAEAVRELLRTMNIHNEIETLRVDLGATGYEAKINKITKRLKVLEAFQKSGTNPEWMIFDTIPVVPPEFRLCLPISDGLFWTSNFNDLYSHVINRNNRLKNLLKMRSPEIIVQNEKRMLQQAVDSLLNSGYKEKRMGANKNAITSLSGMVMSEGNNFRNNLLDKRLNYSESPVIVINPQQKLSQFKLQKKWELKLFKPFIFHKLEIIDLAA